VGRWTIAVAAALAVFFVLWWVWYVFGWPPAGANRLAVAVPVSAVVSAALSGPLFFWAGQQPRWPDALLSLAPATAGWVDRAELAEVVSALAGGGSGAVALTTGLVGAGGFGKTTLAARACADRRVRRRFRGGIVWVTVGREPDGSGLAARIAEVIAAAGGAGGQAFTSPEQAGRALARGAGRAGPDAAGGR
jgi:NB-ARC domain